MRADAPVAAGGAGHRLLRRVVDVAPGEVRATLLSCLYFFFTFASYFVLRPIRDELAVAGGVRSLPWLFAGTLGAMLVAQPLYAALVVRFRVKRFIAITYQFFAANLLLFYLAARWGTNEVWTGRVFFVWTAVYALFVVSVFWSVMADVFRSEQAKRLFGFIAVGGTLGSLAGSGATALLVRSVGVANLLLVSAALLEIGALFAAAIPGLSAREAEGSIASDANEPRRGRDPRAIGGSVWAGMTHVARSPYLLGIAGFLVLYTLGSTVLYFTQVDVIGAHYATREARTEILARMEFATQALTALTQAFLTGRIIRVFGLPATLAIMPVISLVGFAALGATAWATMPVVAMFVAFSVLRRASNFALTNPAMEVLFTVVSREDKYKAKSFIETFVYRAGDQLGAWGYAGLALLGLGLAGISWVTVPLSAVMLVVGVWLGRRQQAMARDEPVAGSSGRSTHEPAAATA